MTHSFYVVVGGIQLDLPKTDGIGYIKDKRKLEPSLRLTPTCIVYLLWMDAPLPNISTQDIADHSKASAITKFLSCTQALWLVLQLIGRAYLGLAVTELEINTLAHVLCALAMYGFWFSKPFLVEQAHHVKLESELGGVLANYNLFLSPERNISRWFPPCAVFSFLVCDNEPDWDQVTQGLWTAGDTLVIVFRTLRNYNHRLIGKQIYSTLNAREGRDIPKIVLLSQWEHDVSNEDRLQYCTDYSPDQYWYVGWITGWDLHSWIRYWSADEIRTTLSTDEWEYDDFCNEFPNHSHVKPNTKFLSGRTNMLRSFSDHDEYDWARASVMVLLSAGYSPLHLTLWNATFATPAEGWLWRVSSLVISACAVVFSVAAFTWFCDKWVIRKLDELRERIIALTNEVCGIIGVQLVQWLLIRPLLIVFGAFWLFGQAFVSTIMTVSYLLLSAYILARLFLVFESFASLRSQPPSAYQTPQWTQVLPHL